MRLNTADAGETVDVRTFNANSRSNIFMESREVKHKSHADNQIIRSLNEKSFARVPKQVQQKGLQRMSLNYMSIGKPASLLNDLETISSPRPIEVAHPKETKQKAAAFQQSSSKSLRPTIGQGMPQGSVSQQVPTDILSNTTYLMSSVG